MEEPFSPHRPFSRIETHAKFSLQNQIQFLSLTWPSLLEHDFFFDLTTLRGSLAYLRLPSFAQRPLRERRAEEEEEEEESAVF